MLKLSLLSGGLIMLGDVLLAFAAALALWVYFWMLDDEEED